MKLKVVFVCHTCDYLNRQYVGMPRYNVALTEFYSLNDANQHITDNLEAIHEVVPEIKEDK